MRNFFLINPSNSFPNIYSQQKLVVSEYRVLAMPSCIVHTQHHAALILEVEAIEAEIHRGKRRHR